MKGPLRKEGGEKNLNTKSGLGTRQNGAQNRLKLSIRAVVEKSKEREKTGDYRLFKPQERGR